jgi:hypothetical protein
MLVPEHENYGSMQPAGLHARFVRQPGSGHAILLLTRAQVDKLLKTTQFELGNVPLIVVPETVRLFNVSGSAGRVPLRPKMVCKVKI